MKFARYMTVIALFSFAGAAHAQDQTLADIRQELTVLYVDIQKLKTQLSTTGSVAGTQAGNSPLARLDAIEAALQRISNGTFGNCLSCGEPISAERLTAVPFATKCRKCMQ